MLLASLNAITFNVTRFKVVSHTYHIIAANEEAQVDFPISLQDNCKQYDSFNLR